MWGSWGEHLRTPWGGGPCSGLCPQESPWFLASLADRSNQLPWSEVMRACSGLSWAFSGQAGVLDMRQWVEILLIAMAVASGEFRSHPKWPFTVCPHRLSFCQNRKSLTPVILRPESCSPSVSMPVPLSPQKPESRVLIRDPVSSTFWMSGEHLPFYIVILKHINNGGNKRDSRT